MRHRTIILKLLLFTFFLSILPCFSAQTEDKAVYVEVENEYQSKLYKKAGLPDSDKREKVLKLDFSTVCIPSSPSDFKQAWHFPPLCQDLTGACWSFSSISFFESEVYRHSGRKIKLSEMYTVYWEFVEKARKFVRTKGGSAFTRGSQANATPRIWRQYGIVPFEAYPGRKPGTDYFDDKVLFLELEKYMDSLRTEDTWKEGVVLQKVRDILDQSLGAPPTRFQFQDKTLTPKQFLDEVLQINLDDYVDVMSLEKFSFGEKTEYPVRDNWWHSDSYINLPLEDFTQTIRNAVDRGLTVCIVGDNSEPGFYSPLDAAVIADFDILPGRINDTARMLRFANGATTDDHAIHLVGRTRLDGHTWYLIKDSGTRARNGKHPGYMFYREDFIQLKMMNFLVHKDALEGITK
jgi:bleomycin hydrolase